MIEYTIQQDTECFFQDGKENENPVNFRRAVKKKANDTRNVDKKKRKEKKDGVIFCVSGDTQCRTAKYI